MPIPGLSYTDEELFPIVSITATELAEEPMPEGNVSCDCTQINIILPCWLLLIIAPGHKLTQVWLA